MLKDRLYNFFVRKNGRVWYEYERYVREHMEEHRLHRFRHLRVLFKLNWFYRIKKINVPFLYPDVPMNPDVVIYQENEASVSQGDIDIFDGIEKKDPVVHIKDETIFLSIDVIANGLVYQWQYKNENETFWSDSRLDSARTNTIHIKYKENLNIFGREYRCRIRDNSGRVIESGIVNMTCLLKRIYIPETKKINRVKPHWLAMELLSYDIVSFDMFDTLIFRPFDNPKMIFDFVGEKLGISAFSTIRISSEIEARENHFIRFGNRETNLREIYEIIEKRTAIDIEEGMRTECECEVKFCYANPYMKELYDILFFQDKNIVIVTDMYLPIEILEQILKKCGFYNYKKLYVSNECQLSKSDGSIYSLIINDLGVDESRIIHIGDNENGDIIRAKENGIATKLYQNAQIFGQKHRAMNLSSLIGSVYRGIVNNKLYNGKYDYTYAYEYGYSVGGIYVWGYMNYLYRYVQENAVDCILFVARDGYVYKKIFDKYINCNVTTKYLLWSRIASEFSNIENTRESFIDTYVNNKVSAKNPVMIEDLFCSLGLNELIPLLRQYNIHPKANINNSTKIALSRFIISEWDNVVKCTSEYKKSIQEYVAECVTGKQNIVIVDVGWTGNNVIKLRSVINNIDPQKKVTVFLAGYTSTKNSFEELSGNIVPYMFSESKNRDKYYAHHKDKKPTNNLFEILSQAVTPSFYGIKDNKYFFDIPEVENYNDILEIQSGIEDFVLDWIGFVGDISYMNNISGADAYGPFEKKCQDYMWFKVAFGDFCVSLKTLSNSKLQKLETVKEIL